MEYNQPLVSIAVITYQNGSYIAQCIESILSQTYKNIEIIISDDGSTDDSFQIIKTYAEKNNNIKFLTAFLNQGISENINKAFNNCRGKYICLIAGDDAMYPEKIEKQVEFLEKNPEYDLCFHNTDVYEEETKTILFKWLDKYLPTRNPHDALFLANWLLKKIKRKTPSGSWFGRASYLKYAKNDSRTSSSHEFIFTMSMLAAKPESKWHTLQEVLGMYRIHSKGLSRDRRSWIKAAEEISVCYSLAKVKFPQYTSLINNEEAFWWFMQLLYDQVPVEHRRVYMKEFLRKYGFAKYAYLHICKILLSDKFKAARKLVKGAAKTF